MWLPPISRTVATDGSGLPELIESIQAHAAHLHATGGWLIRERARLSAELDLLIQTILVDRFRASLPATKFDLVLDSIQKRKISPREAVSVLLNDSV
jgi:LAO/AO transport system kinase